MNSNPKAAGPYTTITVDEFNRLSATVRHMRKQIQKIREFLEAGATADALRIAKFEDEHL